jgi:cell pole-organizing protein PopZ
MALKEPQAEPSMEEILASIRRIISEDEAPEAPQPVLDLTQPASVDDDDDILVFDKVEEEPEPLVELAPEPVAEMSWDEPEPASPAPAPMPAAPSASHAAISDSILSEPAVQAAATSFTRLAGTIRISDTAGMTLEGVVREMLRPMLREWLDQNLPGIVEARVEAELDRISRLAR